ncbi:MAG: hypothetical protein ACRD68_15695, partial [Pyrinomonadaceae bacterium]
MRLHHFLTILLLCVLISLPHAFARETVDGGGDERHAARAARWDAYALPPGEFRRFVERREGYSLWRPAHWDEARQPDGSVSFGAGDEEGPTVRVHTPEIPDGYGVANYVTSLLREWRKQPIDEETMLVRRVRVGGLEGREFTFEIETEPGRVLRETVWVTAAGARAFMFFYVASPEDHDKHEPLFQRMMLSLRIGAAGHWDEEF